MRRFDWNGAALAAMRESAGFTQEQVAERLGITQITVSRVETNRNASVTLIRRMCHLYGGKPSSVINLDADMPFSAPAF